MKNKSIRILITMLMVFMAEQRIVAQTEIQDELLKLKIRRFYPSTSLPSNEWIALFSLMPSGVHPVDVESAVGDAKDNLILLSQPDPQTEKNEELLSTNILRKRMVINELIETIGQENTLRLIQVDNFRYLKSYCVEKRLFDPTFLSVPFFHRSLGLDEKQTSQLREIDRRESHEKEEAMEALYMEAKDLNLEKYEKLKKILNPKQRDIYSKLIGRPLNWARLVSTDENFAQSIGECYNANPDKDGFSTLFPTSVKFGVEQLVELRKKSKSYDSINIDHFDYVVFSLLRSNFFKKEMELTESQQEDLDVFLKNVRSKSVISNRLAPQAIRQLVSNDRKYCENLVDILLPSQIEWLKEIELQFRTGLHRETFALTHPLLKKRLELTDIQERKLVEIARSYQSSFSDLQKSCTLEVIKVALENAQHKIDILEKDDKVRFLRLLGVDCNNFKERSRGYIDSLDDSNFK